jgi:hypothetical protein
VKIEREKGERERERERERWGGVKIKDNQIESLTLSYLP